MRLIAMSRRARNADSQTSTFTPARTHAQLHACSCCAAECTLPHPSNFACEHLNYCNNKSSAKLSSVSGRLLACGRCHACDNCVLDVDERPRNAVLSHHQEYTFFVKK
eukprot:INCI17303.2.p2 GENE.INCI17303.2~~INCI17303.2.p2  ORF type:complete len:108 (-),score=8.96 INCI17303.2:48-371(-)